MEDLHYNYWEKNLCIGGFTWFTPKLFKGQLNYIYIVVIYIWYICCCSVTKSCLALGDPTDCSKPGFLVLDYLPKFAQIHVHWVSDVIQPSHPLSPTFPPALNLSQHQGLFNDLALSIRWPKYWNFSFSISPPNEYPGLISFRIDCFDLFAIQGIFKSLLQLHNSKASILQHSASFMVQPLHLYMTTGKTIALDYTGLCWQSDVSRITVAFLPRSKCLLISWLRSPSAVILEPPKITFLTVSTFSPSISLEVMGDAIILVFWMLGFQQLVHSPLLPSSRGSLVPLYFLSLEQYYPHTWGCWYFSW